MSEALLMVPVVRGASPLLARYYLQMEVKVVAAARALGQTARVAMEDRAAVRVAWAEMAETVPRLVEAADATRVPIIVLRLAWAEMAEYMVAVAEVDIAALPTLLVVLAVFMAVMEVMENQTD